MIASVIIPAWNRYELTVECVERVAKTDAEIILIDNGSDDHTRNLSVYVDAPRYARPANPVDVVVRNRVNRGFAVGCNQGAAVSQGDVLVFLNNDTEPCDGWLDALLEPFESTWVDIVGPKLVYPDGRIQHAGVTVYRNAAGLIEAANIGRGEVDGGQYDEKTKVDAVTGACLAIRRWTFEALGGFDTAFLNGYEDVDLCLRARLDNAGVLYQPDSVVMHHESASGPERFKHVQHNVDLLQQRWGEKCPLTRTRSTS